MVCPKCAALTDEEVAALREFYDKQTTADVVLVNRPDVKNPSPALIDYPPPSADCPGFQWVGQPICHCDGCGRPIWEHEYDRVPGEGPFHDQKQRRMDDREREIKHLRWRYTMLTGHGAYCSHHKPVEYTDMSLSEIHARWNELDPQDPS